MMTEYKDANQNTIINEMVRQKIIGNEAEVKGLCFLLSFKFIYKLLKEKPKDGIIGTAGHIYLQKDTEALKKYYTEYKEYIKLHNNSKNKPTAEQIDYIVEGLKKDYIAKAYKVNVEHDAIPTTIDNISKELDNSYFLITLNYQNSSHAIAIVKQSGKFYLFAPNHGLYEYENAKDLLNHKWYEATSIVKLSCCKIQKKDN